MLMAKIYGLMWLSVTAVGAVLYLTDSFSFASAMLLGFTTSVLAGAGILVVYPALMAEDLRSGRASKKERKGNFSKANLQPGGSNV